MPAYYTGRTKLRLHRRWIRYPLLVLQREWRHVGTAMESNGGMIDMVPYDFTLWKDARVDDDLVKQPPEGT